MPVRGRPTIPEVRERFVAYYRTYPEGWKNLHVVMDDGNYAAQFVAGAADWAEREGDPEGAELARVLLSMTVTQRAKLERGMWKGVGYARTHSGDRLGAKTAE